MLSYPVNVNTEDTLLNIKIKEFSAETSLEGLSSNMRVQHPNFKLHVMTTNTHPGAFKTYAELRLTGTSTL